MKMTVQRPLNSVFGASLLRRNITQFAKFLATYETPTPVRDVFPSVLHVESRLKNGAFRDIRHAGRKNSGNARRKSSGNAKLQALMKRGDARQTSIEATGCRLVIVPDFPPACKI